MPILTRGYTGPGSTTGGSPSTRVYNEVLTGTINGANTSFTTGVDYTAGNEAVFYNGLRQREGASCDYTRAESGGAGTGFDTIVFAVAPRTGDNLLIDYDPA